jgi:hypothetical protein
MIDRYAVLEPLRDNLHELDAIEMRWAERRASRARMRAAFALIDFSVR